MAQPITITSHVMPIKTDMSNESLAAALASGITVTFFNEKRNRYYQGIIMGMTREDGSGHSWNLQFFIHQQGNLIQPGDRQEVGERVHKRFHMYINTRTGSAVLTLK